MQELSKLSINIQHMLSHNHHYKVIVQYKRPLFLLTAL